MIELYRILAMIFKQLFILGLFPFFCISCHSLRNDMISEKIISDKEKTIENDVVMNKKSVSDAAQEKIHIQTIDYYLNNHACPRLHTDEACRKEYLFHGMLSQVSLIDEYQNQLTLKIFNQTINISDPFMDESFVEWRQTYSSNILMSFFGKSSHRIGSHYSDLYKMLVTNLIPAPTERNLDIAQSDSYEEDIFGSGFGNSFIHYNKHGQPDVVEEFSTPLSDKVEADSKPIYTDPYGHLWKELTYHTYAYDSQGRLLSHFVETLDNLLAPTIFDVYNYDNECVDKKFQYIFTPEGLKLIHTIQYKSSNAEQLSYIIEENRCTQEHDCYNTTPGIWEESRRDCPEQLEWIIPEAITQYDRRKNTWISKLENISSNPSEQGKYYSPDKPFDYNDVVKHYYEYELDPKYSFEPRDYTLLTDPDAAHPSRPFQMASKPVTQKDFTELMGFNPSYFQSCGETCPVENVTWYQALAYSNALSEKQKRETCYELRNCSEKFESCEDVIFKGLDCKGYRLPTDEEWRSKAATIQDKVESIGRNKRLSWFNKEKNKLQLTDIQCELDDGSECLDDIKMEAAQLGLESEKNYYNEIAWFIENSELSHAGCVRIYYYDAKTHAHQFPCVMPHPVGQKKADPNGFYDFYGNVFEWIWDWYGYTSRSGDSLGPDRGYCRIMRGGSIFSEQNLLNHRYCYPPDRGGSVLGFRLVRTL